MIIKLDDTYYIQVNPSTYNLGKKVEQKNGEIMNKPFAYCTTLPQAIERYIRELLADKEYEASLGDYISAYNAEVEKISALINLKDVND